MFEQNFDKATAVKAKDLIYILRRVLVIASMKRNERNLFSKFCFEGLRRLLSR